MVKTFKLKEAIRINELAPLLGLSLPGFLILNKVEYKRYYKKIGHG